MNYFRCAAVMLLLAAFAPAPSRAQAKKAPRALPPDYSTKYERSPAGLLVQFQMILTNAKDPDKMKLLIDELALPKYDDYFNAVYQPDVELFWAGSYTRALMRAGADFQSLFARLGMEEGEFNIRRINDAPASKLEQALAAKTKGPMDIYAVSWKKRNATDSSSEDLLGYYAYLSGRFRWFYMLGYPKTPGAPDKTAVKPATPSKAPDKGTGTAATPQSSGAPSSSPSSTPQ